ncbi:MULTISPECIES: hypothetical protein [unclassified Blastococcus]
MTDSRFAIGLDALEATVRVAPADQVPEQPASGPPPTGQVGDPHPYAGGAAGDADGD